MDSWGAVVGLGLLAAAVSVIAFVRYRERETTTLQRDVALAREMRDLAGGDDVRVAAVDEFELAIYQRLFYASVVAPRIRSAAWALLGAVLAVTAALATGPGDGLLYSVVHIVAIIVAVGFGIGAVAFAALAVFHTATTPRVSFADSYAGSAETE